MSIYNNNPEFYSQPVRLDKDQRKDPLKVIEEFFDFCELCHCREKLDKWLNVALTTDNTEYMEPRERSDIMYFREKLEELIEAAYILSTKRHR